MPGNKVYMCDLNGKWMCTIGEYGTGPVQFNAPIGLAVDATGDIYVGDYNPRVQRISECSSVVPTTTMTPIYTETFTFTMTPTNTMCCGVYDYYYGSNGSGNGLFNSPMGIYANDSIIAVADMMNNRVQLFDILATTLGFRRNIGESELSNPYDVSLRGDYVYITDTGNDRVCWYGINDGILKGQHYFGVASSLRNIAVDNDGLVYIVDRSSNAVHQYDPLMDIVLYTWNSCGSHVFDTSTFWGVDVDDNKVFVSTSQGYIITYDKITKGCDGYWVVKPEASSSEIHGISLDKSGNILLVNSSFHRIDKYTRAGAYICSIGNFGANPGYFFGPQDVSVNAFNSMFTVEAPNNRIQHFSLCE